MYTTKTEFLKWFEMRIPPVGVFLVCAGLMYMIQRFSTTVEVELLYRLIVIAPVAFGGSYVALMGVLQFKTSKTTVNPFKPEDSTVLVSDGVYAFSRNPMYLGLLCYLIALFFYFLAPLAVLGPLFFKLYIDRFQIYPEERRLMKIFGEQYEWYLGHVNRWIGSKSNS
jgi:protein-S-isoprenylcysteine O-methyltransferase Ste14